MGYTITEARRGLRSSQGNIDQAIEFIIEVRRTLSLEVNYDLNLESSHARRTSS